jgi:mono/diheme cytochrome c family protein
MKAILWWSALGLAGTLALTSSLFAGAPSAKKEAGSAPVASTSDSDAMRIEGERRFHANCSRCHAAPQKFPPRMMGTVLRHMRVRATITNEDQRLILFYMTQ